MTVGAATYRLDLPPISPAPPPVEPVRPVSRQAERGFQQGDGAAARTGVARGPAAADTSHAAEPFAPEVSSASILPFPERRTRSLAFAPFIAQQLAQQDEPDVSGDARLAARAAHAYRVAAGQEDRILGPVRPQQLAV